MTICADELRHISLRWLTESDPTVKSAGVHRLAENWAAERLTLEPDAALQPCANIPGKPQKPELVAAKAVKRRSMHTIEGRAAMVHALAHIEFNAINLALDAIWRFSGMPHDYYTDWLQVAAEEAQHFNLLAGHLGVLGYQYGDFPAHGSLWEMADKTSHDILARIALIPRTMEARGLDASPMLRHKLAQAGDLDGAAILDIILRDEIGHVRIGNRWFNWLCEQRGLEPVVTYATLTQAYGMPPLRGPFNLDARRAAGFTDNELAALTA
jgi:uncharacterized ferritin-like protein (DUF455 family)